MTDQELVQHLAKWERRIARLQRKHPARWHVPGLSDEEVRDALTLALFEAHRSNDPREPLEIVTTNHADLRKRFRIVAPPADLSDAPIRHREPNQEEALAEHEDAARFGEARAAAEFGLSRPQRRWLAAMKMAANNGQFFEASDTLNLSAASRILGKNRSSAKRAYAELQALFQRELTRR